MRFNRSQRQSISFWCCQGAQTQENHAEKRSSGSTIFQRTSHENWKLFPYCFPLPEKKLKRLKNESMSWKPTKTWAPNQGEEIRHLLFQCLELRHSFLSRATQGLVIVRSAINTYQVTNKIPRNQARRHQYQNHHHPPAPAPAPAPPPASSSSSLSSSSPINFLTYLG